MSSIPTFAYEKIRGDTIEIDFTFSQIATFTGAKFYAYFFTKEKPNQSNELYYHNQESYQPSSEFFNPFWLLGNSNDTYLAPVANNNTPGLVYPSIAISSEDALGANQYGKIEVTDSVLKTVRLTLYPASTDYLDKDALFNLRIRVIEQGGRATVATKGTIKISV